MATIIFTPDELAAIRGSSNVPSTPDAPNISAPGPSVPSVPPNQPAPAPVTGSQILDIDWNNPVKVFTHGMQANSTAVVRFTTGGPSTRPSTISGTNPTMTSFLAYLSETIDDYRQPGPLGYGAIGNGISPTVFFTISLDGGLGYPILKANTVYYFNIKIQTPGNSGICDGEFNLNPR